MVYNLLKVLLAGLIMFTLGCAATMEAARKAAEERERYIQEIESKVDGTTPETLRQAKVRAIISKPLPVVYRAAVSTLSHLDRPAIVTPTPRIIPDKTQRTRIIYSDDEPVFHEGKPIQPASAKGFFDHGMGGGIESLYIYVTLFLEAKGPRATTVCFYPHNRLCTRISEELQKVVDDNMTYRGRLFVNRLQTQIESQRRWLWITE